MFSVLVIGLDPSRSSHEACRTGMALAKALGANVHLVTAFKDSVKDGFETSLERRNADRTLENAAADLDPTGRATTTHAVPGSPRMPSSMLRSESTPI